jgi:hypothetical protein
MLWRLFNANLAEKESTARMTMTKPLVVRIAGAICLVALAATAIIFQDSITRYRWSPRAPFDVIPPPPAPEYGARGAWLMEPDNRGAKPIDVFYIHSTAYASSDRWNAPITDEKADRTRREIAAPNEAGPFAAMGDIYAPRYREATLFTKFTHKYDGLAARELAYSDVRRAFTAFLVARDEKRPLIIVGYGQGGLHATGLLNEFFVGEKNPLRLQLVAAYAINAGVSTMSLPTLAPQIPLCADAKATRCLIAWNDLEQRFDEEMTRLRNRSLAWTADQTLDGLTGASIACVNPLNWTPDGPYSGPDNNIGAASATGVGFSASPPALKGSTGARCDRGILIVDRPREPYLRRGHWFGAKWRAPAFNLFFHDIAANVEIRLNALQARLEEEAKVLEPIEQSVEIGASPIKRAPPL